MFEHAVLIQDPGMVISGSSAVFIFKNRTVVGSGNLYIKMTVTSGSLITSQSYSSGICGPWSGTLRISKALPQRLW